MFNDKVQNAISSLAVMLETPDVVAKMLSGCCDFEGLSEYEKRELGSIISKILIGFLCSDQNTQQSILITGSTDGALDERFIINMLGFEKITNPVSADEIALIG